jgi:hypothetical protein
MFAFHDADVVDEAGHPLGRTVLGSTARRGHSQSRLVAGARMPTASVMFRRDLVDRVPAGYREVLNADTYLFAMGGQYGTAAYVDVRPSGYRVHGGGIWSSQKREFHIRNNLHTFQTLLRDIQPQFRATVGYNVCLFYNRLIRHQLRTGQLIPAARSLVNYVCDAGRQIGIRAVGFQARMALSSLASPVRRWLQRRPLPQPGTGTAEPAD